MKILPAALVLALLGSSVAFAQQPAIPRIDRVTPPNIPTNLALHSSSLSPSQLPPDLWLYIQEQRRHDDPAQAVRRKAEYQASQRQTRIASAKWFGYSNSRPEASPIPTMGTYSTGWSGNSYDRYEWITNGTPYIWAYGGLIR
jgi:hypothetical protein